KRKPERSWPGSGIRGTPRAVAPEILEAGRRASAVDRARRPSHGVDLQRRRADDPVLPGAHWLSAGRADGEPRLQGVDPPVLRHWWRQPPGVLRLSGSGSAARRGE